jgi:hypothetical protein
VRETTDGPIRFVPADAPYRGQSLKGASGQIDADLASVLVALRGVDRETLTPSDLRDLRTVEQAVLKAGRAVLRLRKRHGWENADWDEQ